MNRFKRLIVEIHNRSLWQVLLIYVGGAWVCYEIIDTITDRLALPEWLPALAIILFLIGLPVVLATAFVGGAGAPSRAPVDGEVAAAQFAARRRHRFLTWRNAAATFVIVLAAWGVVATGWLVFADRIEPDQMEAAEKTRRSIAVLPFDNLSPDPESEYFADGMHDEIITQLFKIADLKVISRTSVMEYKGRSENLRAIAEELGVTNILEGTVRHADGRVRITTQLVDALADEHLWAEVYDRDLSDVFAVQSDVARQVAVALRMTLSPAQIDRIEDRPTENLQAYNHYLQGLHYYHLGEYENAIEYVERAVELDASFALAYTLLSFTENDFYWVVTEARTDERLARVKTAAERALQIDPDLPYAHLAMGYYYHRIYEFERALEHYAIARAGLPSHSDIYFLTGAELRSLGQWEEAAVYFSRWYELNPGNHWAALELGLCYHSMGRYAEAEEYYGRVIQLHPHEFVNYLYNAALYVSWHGDSEKAREVLQEGWNRVGRAPLFSLNDYLLWWVYRIVDEDYERTLRQVASGFIETDTTGYYLTKAELHILSGDTALGRAYYDSARVLLESQLVSAPSDASRQAHIHSQLGLAYAGVGRKEEAVQAAEMAVALFPVSKKANRGPDWVAYLAETYVMVGEYDSAIDELEYLLSIPGSFISAAWLRVDPMWDPLRDHPRFQELLQRYGQ